VLSDRLATVLGGGDDDDDDVAEAIQGLSLEAAGPQQPEPTCGCQFHLNEVNLSALLFSQCCKPPDSSCSSSISVANLQIQAVTMPVIIGWRELQELSNHPNEAPAYGYRRNNHEQPEQQAEEALQAGDDLLDALLGSDDDDAFASLAPAAPAAPQPIIEPEAAPVSNPVNAVAIAEVGSCGAA